MMPRTNLREGYEISRIIRGGWQLSGDHGPVDRAAAVDDMVAFYDAGITTFDCADIYTGVEELYGEALVNLAHARGEEAARSVRIHTKFVPDIGALAELSRADVERIIRRSCARLGRERLDLVQFHWWDYGVPGMLEAVGHLKALQEVGLIERIGITNFDRAHMEAIAAEVDLVSAQVQFSLLDRRPSGAFAEAARARGVSLICYGALAGGFLTDQWLGRSDPGFAFENRSLVKYRLIIEECGGWEAFQALLTTMRRIADREGADIAAVATTAMLSDPEATAVIIGARSSRHLPRFLAALEVTLTEADREALTLAGPSGEVYALERDISGRHGRIMKYNLNDG